MYGSPYPDRDPQPETREAGAWIVTLLGFGMLGMAFCGLRTHVPALGLALVFGMAVLTIILGVSLIWSAHRNQRDGNGSD